MLKTSECIDKYCLFLPLFQRVINIYLIKYRNILWKETTGYLT
jgi:hypothetical protein